MFLRWSLSYLIISVIALLLILFSGFRYTAVLRENLEYTNGIQLDMTCVWLDQKLGLLRNITAKESLDSSITKIRNATDYDTTPKFSYYLLTKEVATDLISFGIEDPYFLYFPATDAMVMPYHTQIDGEQASIIENQLTVEGLNSAKNQLED